MNRCPSNSFLLLFWISYLNGASFQSSSAVICSLSFVSFLFSCLSMGRNCSPFLALDRVITYPDDLYHHQSCGCAALIPIFSLFLLSRGSLPVQLGRGHDSSRDGRRERRLAHARSVLFFHCRPSLSSTVEPAGISSSYFTTYFFSGILPFSSHSYPVASFVCFYWSSDGEGQGRQGGQ